MKKVLFSLTFTTLSFLIAATPALAQGPQAWSGVCVENGVATILGLQCLLANVLSVGVTVIGLIGFVMFIYSAFQLMLSGGNSKATESARNAITYAVVGIVVAISAFIILNLLAAFTGVSLLTRFSLSVDNFPVNDPNIEGSASFGGR